MGISKPSGPRVVLCLYLQYLSIIIPLLLLSFSSTAQQDIQSCLGDACKFDLIAGSQVQTTDSVCQFQPAAFFQTGTIDDKCGTHFWKFGDGATAFGDTVSHTYTQSGTYQVKHILTFTYPNGTVCTDTAYSKTMTLTGIDEKKGINTFSVLPNPAEDQITIELSNQPLQDNTTLLITDINGVEVKKRKLNRPPDQSIKVNTSEWSPGVYFVSLQQDGQLLQTKKVVLER